MKNRRLPKLIFFAIFFLFSVYFHSRTINRPFVGHHDFMNGTLINTVDIWRRDGVLTHAFAPVYTYNSFAPIENGFGVKGRNDRLYYVSYPPGVYVFFYLFTKLPFTGLKDSSVRIASITSFAFIWILFCLYLNKRYGFRAAAVGLGALSLYPISVYFMGSIFYVDLGMIIFWLTSFFSFRYILSRPYNLPGLLLFFFLLFYTGFTEWLGLFLGISVFCLVLFFGKIFNWNRKYRLFFLINTAIWTVMPIVTTYLLYLVRINKNVLDGQFINRFLYRSGGGRGLFTPQALGYFREFYQRMLFHIGIGFGGFFFQTILIMLVFIIIGIIFKIRILKKKDFVIYLAFFFLAPFLHFIVLNNFHHEHDFGYMYFLFGIIMIFVWAYKSLEGIVNKYWEKAHYSISFLYIIGIFSLIYFTSLKGYSIYLREWVYHQDNYVEYYKSINKITNEEDLVLTSLYIGEYNNFYHKRNAIGYQEGPGLENYIYYYPKIRDLWYISEVRDKAAGSCGVRQMEYKEGLYVCKLN